MGNELAKADTIVAVANPLEALSYREIFLLDDNRRDKADKITPPLIISLDTALPTPAFIEQIQKTKKRFRLATNTPLRRDRNPELIPLLLDSNGEFFDWFEIEQIGEDLPVKDRPLAWTRLLAEKVAESKNFNKKKILTK